jgi:hypothetical protein
MNEEKKNMKNIVNKTLKSGDTNISFELIIAFCLCLSLSLSSSLLSCAGGNCEIGNDVHIFV